jgi:hypothetical protein
VAYLQANAEEIQLGAEVKIAGPRVQRRVRPPVPSRRSDPGGWLNFEINPMDHSRATVVTHLAREGRMTVTIGRRDLLVALGGVAAWLLAARAASEGRARGLFRQVRPHEGLWRDGY